nr:hypothetical protein [uncultured Mediterraneibacter sp.]
MVQHELNYRVTLINCNGKELQAAKYLQIFAGMEELDARKIVSVLPRVLFDSLDGEACSYIEDAFDFYGIKYSLEQVDETYDIPDYPSAQVIALGSMVDYFGQRTEYSNIGRKYGFKVRGSLNDTPFLVKDGLTEQQAESLKMELRNMGMSAQVMRSSSKVQGVKRMGLLESIFSKKF